MGICKEKAVKYGPLSHLCSRIIPSPADCQGKFGPANTYLIDALLPQNGNRQSARSAVWSFQIRDGQYGMALIGEYSKGAGPLWRDMALLLA